MADAADMRIVYPLSWARPTREASQAQSMATVAALARRGCEVTLLMPRGADDPALAPADLREWFAVEGEFRLHQRRSRWSGDAIARTVMWLREVFDDPAVQQADLLYSRIPAMLGAGQVSPLPFVTDHYRPWPDVYPWVKPFFRRTSRHAKCLGLVLHSHHAADSYRRAGLLDDGILVAHNGFEPPVERLDKAAARRHLNLPADRSIAVYAGRINAEKGLDTVLALADRRPQVMFVLVGAESRSAIERAAAARANVRIEPWVEPAALPMWLFAADVLVVPPSRAPLERFGTCVLPMKLFAYLAAGRSILAPDAPDTREVLRHGETALLVEPDRPEAAAEALDRLVGDTSLAASLSEAARARSESFTWDARAEKIAAFLQRRLAQRSA